MKSPPCVRLVYTNRCRQSKAAMGPVVLLDGGEVVNLCSNNYLGLADHPTVVKSAKAAMDRHGYGTASVRFICGTLSVHEQLEQTLAEFTGMERATTYVSCWTANQALVTTLLNDGGVVISDELNHRQYYRRPAVCAARRYNGWFTGTATWTIWRRKLAEVTDVKRKLIITDGVFSMEGDLANLPAIVELGKKFDALVAVDDSHRAWRGRTDRTRHGGTFRCKGRHCNGHAGQGAGRSCRRIHRVSRTDY